MVIQENLNCPRILPWGYIIYIFFLLKTQREMSHAISFRRFRTIFSIYVFAGKIYVGFHQLNDF